MNHIGSKPGSAQSKLVDVTNAVTTNPNCHPLEPYLWYSHTRTYVWYDVYTGVTSIVEFDKRSASSRRRETETSAWCVKGGLVGQQTCDREVAGSTFGRALLRSNLRQVVRTIVCLVAHHLSYVDSLKLDNQPTVGCELLNAKLLMRKYVAVVQGSKQWWANHK